MNIQMSIIALLLFVVSVSLQLSIGIAVCSIDDKHRFKTGEPGYLVALAIRGCEVGDHNFIHFSIKIGVV